LNSKENEPAAAQVLLLNSKTFEKGPSSLIFPPTTRGA
jgi:hypothetical protein